MDIKLNAKLRAFTRIDISTPTGDSDSNVVDISKYIPVAITKDTAEDCSEKLQKIIDKADKCSIIYFPNGYYTFRDIIITKNVTIKGDTDTHFVVPYVNIEDKIISHHYSMFLCNSVAGQYGSDEEVETTPIDNRDITFCIKNISFIGQTVALTDDTYKDVYSDPVLLLRECNLILDKVSFVDIYNTNCKDDIAASYYNFPNLIRNIDGNNTYSNITIDNCRGKELMWLPCPTKFDSYKFTCDGLIMSNYTGSVNTYTKYGTLKNLYQHDVITSGSALNMYNAIADIDGATSDGSTLAKHADYPYYTYPVRGGIDLSENGFWICDRITAKNIGDTIAVSGCGNYVYMNGGYCNSQLSVMTANKYLTLKHRVLPTSMTIIFDDCYYAGTSSIITTDISDEYLLSTKYISDNNITPNITYNSCNVRLNFNSQSVPVNVSYNKCKIYSANNYPEFVTTKDTSYMFTMLADKPTDWETSYGNYYIFASNIYRKNTSNVWEDNKYYSVGAVTLDEEEWNYSFITRNWKIAKSLANTLYGLIIIPQSGLFGSANSVAFNLCEFDDRFNGYLTGNNIILDNCNCKKQLYLPPKNVRNITLRDCINIEVWSTLTGLKAADIGSTTALESILTVKRGNIAYGTADGGYRRLYNDNELIPKYLLDEFIPAIESIDSETIDIILNSAYNAVISRTIHSPRNNEVE